MPADPRDRDLVEAASKERTYDERIAPLMNQIIAICKEHKINSHATFLLDGDAACTTHLQLDGDPLALYLLYLAAYCRNNVDLMYIELGRRCKDGRFNGDASAVIRCVLDCADARRQGALDMRERCAVVAEDESANWVLPARQAALIIAGSIRALDVAHD